MSSLSAPCPLCETNLAGYSHPHPHRNRPADIARLLERVERLDNAMQRIVDMKHATLRELNDIRPVSSSLPFEILAHIFHLACPPINFNERSLCEAEDCDDFLDNMSDNGSEYPQPRNIVDLRYRYFPLVLGAVCSRWRSVAWATPELWTTFALEILERKLETQIPLLRLYLTNSGVLPVSLDLDMRVQHFAYVEKYEEDAVLVQLRVFQSLANLVFDEFPRKIRTLRLAGAPSAWMAYLSQERFPSLQDLTVGWGIDVGDKILVKLEGGAFNVTPVLARVPNGTAILPPIPGARPPMPALTTLHLRNVELPLCAKILYYMPRLIEYCCYEPTMDLPENEEDDWHFVPFREPFTLPALKRFGWTSKEGERINIDILTNIRLPSLEEVQWKAEEILTEDFEAILSFFSNLPETVHSLSYYEQDTEFFESSDDYHHYRRVLSTIPHIRTLTFNRCSASFMRSIFSLLSCEFLDSKSKCLLPCLDRIIVRNFDDDGDDLSVAFVEMVKTRRSVLRSQSFKFETVGCEVVWSHSAQDGLRELAYDFALTLTERSKEKVYGCFTDRELEIFTSGVDKVDEIACATNSPGMGEQRGPSSSEASVSNPIWADIASGLNIFEPATSPSNIFSQEFMQGMTNVLDGIDPLLYRPGDDLNFERDFGQWFNQPDDPLDLH